MTQVFLHLNKKFNAQHPKGEKPLVEKSSNTHNLFFPHFSSVSTLPCSSLALEYIPESARFPYSLLVKRLLAMCCPLRVYSHSGIQTAPVHVWPLKPSWLVYCDCSIPPFTVNAQHQIINQLGGESTYTSELWGILGDEVWGLVAF